MIQASVPVTRNHHDSGQNLPAQGCEKSTWNGRRSTATVSSGCVLMKSCKVTSKSQTTKVEMEGLGFTNVKAVGSIVTPPAICVGDLVL